MVTTHDNARPSAPTDGPHNKVTRVLIGEDSNGLPAIAFKPPLSLFIGKNAQSALPFGPFTLKKLTSYEQHKAKFNGGNG